MFTKYQLTPQSAQNNQCPGCGKLFKSNAAFDKHRTGPFGTHDNTQANRRCMNEQEMLDCGMGQNAKQQWVTALYTGTPFYALESTLEGDETLDGIAYYQDGELDG